MNAIERVRATGCVLNDYVLIAKTLRGAPCEGGGRMIGGIVLPELSAGITNFVEIMAVGSECKLFLPWHSRWNRRMREETSRDFGETVWCPDIATNFHYAGQGYGTELYFFREKDLLPVLIDGTRLTPLGDWVVLERTEAGMNDRNGEIATVNLYRTLEKWCTVVEAGQDCTEVKSGDRVLVSGKAKTFGLGVRIFSCVREGEIDAVNAEGHFRPEAQRREVK